ncbi:hypothetical protein HIM_09223 [Hirsutella minnesotensis 3608]|uniref:Major facilitator superfamily (MFS) profile domain-containing protein n=1 Tax=Hirsutella minnesotensis 3608 TaxID=1043627 RepID=A0A0F7ZXV5_9HYPO|nr:hypothetical protein HIM_09223 [Hirsutella minnesotensis 3608]
MTATVTTAIELENAQPPNHFDVAAQAAHEINWPRDGEEGITDSGNEETAETDSVAARTVPMTEKWNEPRRNSYRLAAAFWCFLVMGANDAVYGLEVYYSLTYIIVSLVFLSPFVGYVSSALLNNRLHNKLGQRGVGIIGSASHLAAYAIIAAHPPYGVLVFAFALAGFGNGVSDAAWNAWVGNLANSSELLGFLHSFYGAGGVVSPLIATTLVTKASVPWYYFYYIMIGLAGTELITLPWAFWDSDGAAYPLAYGRNQVEKQTGLGEVLVRKPSARVTWVAAVFLLCYVGVEVALGGWIVVFMLRVRQGEAFASGMSAVGFWLGITIGRAILGFVTPRLGVKTSTAIYMLAVMALELVFWLVPQFYVSAVAVSLQGFFLGPMFPNAILMTSKLLPRHLHVVVIGFASAFGGCGAALLPFLTGIVAQSAGVRVLQPIILALLAMMLAVWLCFPRQNRKKE